MSYILPSFFFLSLLMAFTQRLHSETLLNATNQVVEEISEINKGSTFPSSNDFCPDEVLQESKNNDFFHYQQYCGALEKDVDKKDNEISFKLLARGMTSGTAIRIIHHLNGRHPNSSSISKVAKDFQIAGGTCPMEKVILKSDINAELPQDPNFINQFTKLLIPDCQNQAIKLPLTDSTVVMKKLKAGEHLCISIKSKVVKNNNQATLEYIDSKISVKREAYKKWQRKLSSYRSQSQ